MRQRLANFMVGRNGNDRFNVFLMVISLIFLVAAGITQGFIGKLLYIPAGLLLIYVYFRMFSRNVYKRREENNRYIAAQYKVAAWYRVHKERWIQRKDYKFFTCPSCHTTLRVPRGHGKIKIVCRKCGDSFIGKT